MVGRQIEQYIGNMARQFRSLLVVGPRQAGKSTAVRQVFPQKPYVSLENPDMRRLATDDPRTFLSQYPDGAILDEVQEVPQLFSYLQEILDRSATDGLFILTGSNNVLLQSNVSQSLAGRIGIIDMLPLTYSEVMSFGIAEPTTDSLAFTGWYPEIYDRQRDPALWYQSYIRTYVERDVRLVRNISDHNQFIRFVRLCAGRAGQMLNTSALSVECGIDIKTVQSWISVLESTYVIRLLQPYHRNFNKRLVKSPKLYFYDTGLLCALLGMRHDNELQLSHFRGAVMENMIIMEMAKHLSNTGSGHGLYFWRDNKGVEVDLILETGTKFYPFEIKSGKTFQSDFTDNLLKFNKYAAQSGGFLLYDGEMSFTTTSGIDVRNWRSIAQLSEGLKV